MSTDAKQRKKAVFGLIVAALLWSTGGILVKLINWDPVPISGARSLVALIVILIYLRKPKITFSKAQMLGALGNAGAIILYVIALKMTTAANAIMLQYTSPIHVAILSTIFLKERARWFDWGAIVLVLGGMSLFFVGGISPGNMIGNLFAIASGVCLAIMIVALRHQKDASPVESILLGNLIAVIFSIPFVATAGIPDFKSIIGLVLLGVFQLGISYIFFAESMKHATAMEGALIPIIEPLLNPVWVLLFIGERPSGFALIGAAIVILTISLRSIISKKYMI